MTNRRHIHIVLDRDAQGNMLEINRAHQSDEFLREDGSLGQTAAVNVTEETLAGLLPIEAKLIAQIAALTDAKAEAENTAATATKAEAEAKAALEAEKTNAATAAEAHATAIAALQSRIDELTAAPTATITYMSDLWRRATDEESVVIESIIASLPAKQRNLLNSVTYLDHSDPQFPDIIAALSQAFSADRANELLAGSQA